MTNSSAARSGLITGILMIISSILIFYIMGNFENSWQYITYAIYVAGIYWTLDNFRKATPELKSFKQYFSHGFKCFIVVTLLMVIFTYVFIKLNPSLEAQTAANYRIDLEKKGNLTPPEIDENIMRMKQYYTTMLTSMAIFGYLVIGAMATAVISGVMLQKQK